MHIARLLCINVVSVHRTTVMDWTVFPQHSCGSPNPQYLGIRSLRRQLKLNEDIQVWSQSQRMDFVVEREIPEVNMKTRTAVCGHRDVSARQEEKYH